MAPCAAAGGAGGRRAGAAVAGLDGYVEQAGQAGPLAFVGIAGLACGFGVPRQVVAYAGGLAFGFWPGSALALLAEGLAARMRRQRRQLTAGT